MRAAITILAGDGIGPEVVREGVKVLRAVGHCFNHTFTLRHALIGGAALDTGAPPLPAETLAECRSSDAVLLGAVGGPKWDSAPGAQRPEQGLLQLRQGLALFANLRPVQVHPALVHASPLRPERLAGLDLLVVRELTGGIYFGAKERNEAWATDVCRYSVAEIERVVRVAARMATARRGSLTSVDKANVLETSRLWRETTTAIVSKEFPELHLRHMLVDAAAMHLLRSPNEFDVIVTENMFGDILTDEASMLSGSLGLLPSASLGAASPYVFEPIHGSAPDLAGKNVANPYATILSVALLLRFALQLPAEADAVETAVSTALFAKAWSVDLGGNLQTSTIGDAVVAELHNK